MGSPTTANICGSFSAVQLPDAIGSVLANGVVTVAEMLEGCKAQGADAAVAFTRRDFVLADIPGLIEGAAEGAGIGDRFLGHIERCRVLIHLIDIAGDDPAQAMRTVEEELEAYGEGLEDKPRLIVLNKLDLADRELSDAFAEELMAAGADAVHAVSGATGAGVEALLDAVLGYLPEVTPLETESSGGVIEDDGEEGESSWSPI